MKRRRRRRKQLKKKIKLSVRTEKKKMIRKRQLPRAG